MPIPWSKNSTRKITVSIYFYSYIFYSEEEIETNAELLADAKVLTPEEEMIAQLSADHVDDVTLDTLRYGLEGKLQEIIIRLIIIIFQTYLVVAEIPAEQ